MRSLQVSGGECGVWGRRAQCRPLIANPWATLVIVRGTVRAGAVRWRSRQACCLPHTPRTPANGPGGPRGDGRGNGPTKVLSAQREGEAWRRHRTPLAPRVIDKARGRDWRAATRRCRRGRQRGRARRGMRSGVRRRFRPRLKSGRAVCHVWGTGEVSRMVCSLWCHLANAYGAATFSLVGYSSIEHRCTGIGVVVMRTCPGLEV